MSDHKKRWAGWVMVMAEGRTFLGKMRNSEADAKTAEEQADCYRNPMHFELNPCIQIIEQFPVVPGQANQPVILPVASFTTIGMFGTDEVMTSVWASVCINMDSLDEEALEPYSKAYDGMLEQARKMREAMRLQKSAIRAPNADDIGRFGGGKA